MSRDSARIEGKGTLSNVRLGLKWSGRYRVAARAPRTAAPHRTYGTFLTDEDVDIRLLDDFIAGVELQLTMEDGRAVAVKVGGIGERKLVLVGVRSGSIGLAVGRRDQS
jgi:hypothetical protein